MLKRPCIKSRPSLALGAMPEVHYRVGDLHLEPGDEIYLYTDGIVEQPDPSGKLYGEDRLLRVLSGPGRRQKDLLDAVLADVRKKIGSVSPEQQVYLGTPPSELLTAAFRKKPLLLLLDEPCYNQGPAAAKKILARIASWLDRHPRAAAVCVSHRADQVPAGFNRVLDLGKAGGYN